MNWLTFHRSNTWNHYIDTLNQAKQEEPRSQKYKHEHGYTWRLLLQRSSLQMAAKLREGLGRASRDMPLKSTISSLSSSIDLSFSLSLSLSLSLFLKSILITCCCCSYIILLLFLVLLPIINIFSFLTNHKPQPTTYMIYPHKREKLHKGVEVLLF